MTDNHTHTPYYTPDVSIILGTEFRVYDALISVAYWVCLFVGVPGNALSLVYFIQTKKRNLSTMLYIITCGLDIFCSMIQTPVALGLLRDRAPGLLFSNSYTCSTWHFIALILQQMTMYVTMLLALTRTIVIVFPFCIVRKNLVLLSVAGNLIYHACWNIAYYINAEPYYSTATALCTVYEHNLLSILYNINYNICTLVPPVIILVSIIVAVSNLRNTTITSNSSKRRCRHSSMTIVYFSLVFLIANSISFINNSLYIVTLNEFKVYPGPIYDNNFMFFYSWQFSFLFCTVVNSALNPPLYFWRMSLIRVWIVGLCRKNRGQHDLDNINMVIQGDLDAIASQTTVKLRVHDLHVPSDDM